MTQGAEFIQRNCSRLAKGAVAGPPERRNMADRAKRQRQIARKGADVSSFAARDFQLGMVRIGA